MARPCTICARADRQDVDAALLTGLSLRDVARNSGTSKSALSRHRAHLAPELVLPEADGGWQLVLADPPWRFEVRDRATGLGRSADAHYPTMELKDILALPVRRIAAPSSVLLLWTTMVMLADAQRVIRAWGFTYKTCAFAWTKLNADGSPFSGTGYYTRSNTELCLLATRGQGLPRLAMDVGQAILSRRREHSRKPDGVYDRIARLFGSDVRRLELFARTAWPGWATWGREVGRFDAPMLLLEVAA